jgi:SAM-dependent methyltransferase
VQQRYEEHYHRVESVHWWFVARRRHVRDLVLAGNPDRKCSILEAGCSAGPLMQDLRRDGYSNLTGIDISREAIDMARASGLDAHIMDAQKLLFPDESFDVLTASDVLEHLADERAALLEWRRVLRPNGLLIVFVPAFMFLWTEHDLANKHHRRYQRSQLLSALVDAGFRVERSSFWNALLFPPVAAVRGLKRALRRSPPPETIESGDMFLPPAFVNRALLTLLRFEDRLFDLGVNWPLGVSVMALARKAH